jgi:hypothetical protein
LRGQQAKGRSAILSQDKVRPSGTQHAVPIKNDDWTVVRETWDCGISSIAVRFAHVPWNLVARDIVSAHATLLRS